MGKVRITKEFKFEMAHALYGYDGLCANIHGHSYRLWVTVRGDVKKENKHIKDGMVMDFDDLKSIIISHFFKKHFFHICSQWRLKFCFFTTITFSRLGKYWYNWAAEGPITKVNFDFLFLSRKCLIIPVDKTVSPIKFDEITSIFTYRFFC